MKKIYILSLICFSAISLFGQTVMYENFNTYTGSSTVPANWYFSAFEKYTSTASSGPSGPNSFKFGVNGATIISPQFTSGDSVSFYMKLNTSSNDSADTLSIIKVYTSATDTVAQSFTLVKSYANIANAMVRYSMPRNSATYVKVVYTKVGGNVAFDDFAVYSGAFVSNRGVSTQSKSSFNAVQTDNSINLSWNGNRDANYSIIDITGKTVKMGVIKSKESEEISTQNYNRGVYFIVVGNNEFNSTRKIVMN